MNLRSSFSSVTVHSMFLSTNGKLYAWGHNERHCLGLGIESCQDVSHPQELTDPELYEDGGFKDFASGANHSLLLTKKNRIFAWGRNEDGQLGLGHRNDAPTPTCMPKLPDGQIPARVHSGAHFSAILTEDGSVFTMGYNTQAQLGYGEIGTPASIPTQVDLPEPVSEITCGWSCVFALLKSGQVYVWGSNENGQLVDQSVSTDSYILRPTLSRALSCFVHLQAGPFHALGLQPSGALFSWGWNWYGQLGNGEKNEDKDHKQHLIIPQGCREVASGTSISMALMEDNTLFTWGKNDRSELGTGNPEAFGLSPEKVKYSEKSRISCFGSSVEHSFLLTEHGDLYVWGSGPLGVGDDASPKKVPTLLPEWKWELPKGHFWERWDPIFQWLFLGRLDKDSPFQQLHVEILFNFVNLF
jgi:alpha-tubulin suppressor-like RCC1 family protein